MYKLIFTLLFFCGIANAQIVTIPDAFLKTKLISLGVDTNTDGEIQQSEALAVTTLDLSFSDFTDITGIEAFVNLQTLKCRQNHFSTLDVSALTNLQRLDCWASQIVTLNISGLTNLNYLDCGDNEISALDVSTNLGLTDLRCNNNQISVLDVGNLTNLQNLNCYDNLITSLDVSNLTNLTTLNSDHNQLTALNVTNLTNLTFLVCGYNAITTLNVTNLVNLTTLSCEHNQITSLDVTNLTNLTLLTCGYNAIATLNVTNLLSLTMLNCENNQIASLDVTGLTNLQTLNFGSNQIASIDLSDLVNLTNLVCSDNQLSVLNLNGLAKLLQVDCDDNQLTTLDLSQALHLNFIHCSNNQLNSLFIKNGSDEGNIVVSGNPGLQFVCADESQIFEFVAIHPTLASIVNSYCSFVPGGNYNTISGIARFDFDNNGCDTNDIAPLNTRVNFTDDTNQSASFLNAAGQYAFYTQAGSFTLTPAIENQAWFTISPATATIPFADNENNTATQDFCITANGAHPDTEVVIAPTGAARPGFDAEYKIVYKNKGNQTLSGNIVLTYDDNVLDFVTASIVPDAQNTGSLQWNYADLLPFETRSFYITLNVNTPLETPAVNIGDHLTFEGSITPTVGDETAEDNTFVLNQTVVGSLDPNDITCLEGSVVAPSEIGDYLHYAINFENTGTFPAENIVVKTVVDATEFDVSSLQLLNASNAVDARITGNKVEFIFKNIQLPIGGHGHILLKIKTKNTLVTGDAVAKRADIYFDYNAPVDTGMANTVFQTLSNSAFEIDDSVVVFPNPATDEITIKADNNIKSIQLYDAQGRIISTSLVDELVSGLDVSSHAKGIYFIKIITEKGIKVQKLVRG